MICFLAGSMGGDFTIPWRLPNGASDDVSCGLKRWPGRDAMGRLGCAPPQVEFWILGKTADSWIAKENVESHRPSQAVGSLALPANFLHRAANLWRRVGEAILRDGER